MALLGRTNHLAINRFVDFGAFLDGGDLGEILLPKKYLPESAAAGDELEVFVYRDSEDRLVATTETPFAQVGECAYLEVVQVNKNGAFMGWGLGKDLFVPYGEQRQKMKAGKRYVVHVYLDNTGRIAATSKLRKRLSPRKFDRNPGDEVALLIVGPTDLGFEAVVDDVALGMVFHNDALVPLKTGARMTGYIKRVRQDGKIDLALQPPESREVRGDLATQILAHLRASGGSSTLTDKSPPEAIFAEYGVSKRVYKSALGALYKERKVVLKPGRIELATD